MPDILCRVRFGARPLSRAFRVPLGSTATVFVDFVDPTTLLPVAGVDGVTITATRNAAGGPVIATWSQDQLTPNGTSAWTLPFTPELVGQWVVRGACTLPQPEVGDATLEVIASDAQGQIGSQPVVVVFEGDGGGGGGTITAGQITDSTATGRALIRAADAAAGRAALSLGSAATSASTDFAGASHTHPASAISDSTVAGRAVLTAADAAAQRTALELGTAATSNSSAFAGSTHTHSIGDVTGLQAALDARAPLASPVLTGAPTAPTPPSNDDSNRIATTEWVRDNAPGGAAVDLNALDARFGPKPTVPASVNDYPTELPIEWFVADRIGKPGEPTATFRTGGVSDDDALWIQKFWDYISDQNVAKVGSNRVDYMVGTCSPGLARIARQWSDAEWNTTPRPVIGERYSLRYRDRTRFKAAPTARFEGAFSTSGTWAMITLQQPGPVRDDPNLGPKEVLFEGGNWGKVHTPHGANARTGTCTSDHAGNIWAMYGVNSVFRDITIEGYGRTTAEGATGPAGGRAVVWLGDDLLIENTRFFRPAVGPNPQTKEGYGIGGIRGLGGRRVTVRGARGLAGDDALQFVPPDSAPTLNFEDCYYIDCEADSTSAKVAVVALEDRGLGPGGGMTTAVLRCGFIQCRGKSYNGKPLVIANFCSIGNIQHFLVSDCVFQDLGDENLTGNFYSIDVVSEFGGWITDLLLKNVVCDPVQGIGLSIRGLVGGVVVEDLYLGRPRYGEGKMIDIVNAKNVRFVRGVVNCNPLLAGGTAVVHGALIEVDNTDARVLGGWSASGLGTSGQNIVPGKAEDIVFEDTEFRGLRTGSFAVDIGWAERVRLRRIKAGEDAGNTAQAVRFGVNTVDSFVEGGDFTGLSSVTPIVNLSPNGGNLVDSAARVADVAAPNSPAGYVRKAPATLERWPRGIHLVDFSSPGTVVSMAADGPVKRAERIVVTYSGPNPGTQGAHLINGPGFDLAGGADVFLTNPNDFVELLSDPRTGKVRELRRVAPTAAPSLPALAWDAQADLLSATYSGPGVTYAALFPSHVRNNLGAGWDGSGNLLVYAANLPAFTNDPAAPATALGLYVWEPVVNLLSNYPPNVLTTGPTPWFATSGNGVTRVFTDPTDENGLPLWALRHAAAAGTTAAAVSQDLRADVAAGGGWLNGETWTFSAFLKILAGAPIVPLVLRMEERDGSTALSNTQVTPTPAIGGGTLRNLRYSLTHTLNQAGATVLRSAIRQTTPPQGVPFDYTVGVALPVLEKAAQASPLPIIDPTGGGDDVSFNVFPAWLAAALGTLMVGAMLPRLPPLGVLSGLWRMDDGSDANYVRLVVNSAGELRLQVVQGGATRLDQLLGLVVAGVAFRASVRWVAATRTVGWVTSASPGQVGVAVAATAWPSVTRLKLWRGGNLASGAGAAFLNGYARNLRAAAIDFGDADLILSIL